MAHRDRATRQLVAVGVLRDLLRDTLRTPTTYDLPVLGWTITVDGLVIGNCFQTGAADRRAAFETWAAALRATRWDEHTQANGGFTLKAGRHVTRTDHTIDVIVTTDVPPAGRPGGGPMTW